MKQSLLILAFLVGCSEKPSEYVPQFVEDLQHSDPGMRYSAAKSLESLGADARDAAPSLILSLRDRDATVRAAAAYALAGIGPEAAAALPQLLKLLQDKDSAVRTAALYALPAIGPAAETALPAMTQRAANDPDVGVRAAASRALRQMQIAKKYRQTNSK